MEKYAGNDIENQNTVEEKRMPLLRCQELTKEFIIKKGGPGKKSVKLTAVDHINLSIYPGETVGLVGESGCGKSTFGRTLLKLHEPTSGEIWYEDKLIMGLRGKDMRSMRKEMQMIFQDPYASLNPRMTIGASIKAPLDAFHVGDNESRWKMVEEIMEYVGLTKEQMNVFPHEMSGGQRQRAVIARAVILNPKFVVCDEPVSALDVSVRSQVLNLMKKLQLERGMSYLFISHDLSVVNYLSDRVVVMYLGSIVEFASKQELYDNPQHPYTKALLSAIPLPDVNRARDRVLLQGDLPSPMAHYEGCKFCSRCPYADEKCRTTSPYLNLISPVGSEKSKWHMAACFKAEGYTC